MGILGEHRCSREEFVTIETLSTSHPATEIIQRLKDDHPGVPFLALGQTVLWDEPMKAVWRRLLDEVHPDAKFIAGVHDTDYFAKSTALVHDDQPYIMLPHDDGATRGLWSAAGEMSSLFGSEDLATRALYERYHVPFNELAAEFPSGKAEFYAQKTAAFGWRGVVGTRSSVTIAHDVKLSEYMPALLAQLEWAFESSAACLSQELRENASDLHAKLRDWIDEICSSSSECYLSELYEALLPKLYELLLGHPPLNFETTASTRLFQFNSQTCHLSRFRFLGLFLDPATSEICRNAYSAAVSGGGMYALDAFGVGALPFDVVVPGLGRGTLFLNEGIVSLDLPGQKIVIDNMFVSDLASLAQALESRLGLEVALVGKAVALIDMIASEFLIVFHETASGYTDRTLAMNDAIRESGISLDLHPITRLSYPTWDALSALPQSVQFSLPPHLSDSFGRRAISAPDFAKRWRGIVANQRETLKVIADQRTPRDLMRYLDQSGDDTQCWTCLISQYDTALKTLFDAAIGRQPQKAQLAELRQQRFELRARLARLERRKGEHFRRRILPLIEQMGRHELLAQVEQAASLRGLLSRREATRARGFDRRISSMISRVHELGREIKAARLQLRQVERSPKILKTRKHLRGIIVTSEFARLEYVRTAILTTTSLPHTQARPTAWWLPLVDPSGAWFAAIASGTQARLEHV